MNRSCAPVRQDPPSTAIGNGTQADLLLRWEPRVRELQTFAGTADENVTQAEKLEKMRAAALQAEVEAQLSTRYAEKVHTANDNWRPDKDEISLKAEDVCSILKTPRTLTN